MSEYSALVSEPRLFGEDWDVIDENHAVRENLLTLRDQLVQERHDRELNGQPFEDIIVAIENIDNLWHILFDDLDNMLEDLLRM